MSDKMNAEQQRVVAKNMFATEHTGFSKIGVKASTQCDETSFKLPETLVNDGAIFVRRRSASFEGQHNGTEHSANVPLKLITSTPKIANSIDPNNNTNGRSSENERSKSGEIIKTHQFHKVTCSGCEHFHWCPRTHQLMVERSTGTTRTHDTMFRSTSDIPPSQTESYDTPDTASSKSLDSLKRDNDFANSQRKKLKVVSGVSSVIEPSGGERFQSDVSKNVPKDVTSQPLKTSANEISIHAKCLPTIYRSIDIGGVDQEVPQHLGSYDDSSTDEENETFTWPKSETTVIEANKIPEINLDNSLTSENGKPECDSTSDRSTETKKTVKKDRVGADRQSGPLTDISNVIQDKENLSKIQTGENSAIDATIQPKKTRGKINKRKKKSATAQRKSSRHKAENIRN